MPAVDGVHELDPVVLARVVANRERTLSSVEVGVILLGAAPKQAARRAIAAFTEGRIPQPIDTTVSRNHRWAPGTVAAFLEGEWSPAEARAAQIDELVATAHEPRVRRVS